MEQIKFNVWFDKFLWGNGYKWFHPPNGGSRNAIEGAKFKRMGVKKGILDIIIPMARKSFYGLVIELKRVDGKMSDVSEEQWEWLYFFKAQNWSAYVAFGFEQAKSIVKEYLMKSNCCGHRALQARSSGGWYINGKLEHEWFECSNCKQVCDIIEDEPIDQGDQNEQGRESFCHSTSGPTRQIQTDNVREEI